MKEMLRSLKSLGLISYEAKAYLNLLDKGELSAEVLSRNSDISLPRVYTIVEGLPINGFVKIVEGGPKLFDIIDSEETLSNRTYYLEKILGRMLRERTGILGSLPKLKEIYWRNRLRTTPEKFSKDLPSLRDMETKTVEDSAKREIDVFTLYFKWVNRIKDVLNSAISRNVRIWILMQVDDRNSSERTLKFLEIGISVRNLCKAWYSTRRMLVNNSKLIYLIWVRDIARIGEFVVYRLQYTENEELIAAFRESFENRWFKSQDLMETIKGGIYS